MRKTGVVVTICTKGFYDSERKGRVGTETTESPRQELKRMNLRCDRNWDGQGY